MNAKKWIRIVFLIIIMIGLLPYIFIYIFLKSNFENNTYPQIVKRQLVNNSIYGTALNQNTFSYKLALIKEVKPKIISLGSSRVMQFRKESFNSTFVNAGGSINYLNEGYEFLQEMYKSHKPEYIILGLDFFWFNENFPQPLTFPYHQNNGTTIDYKKIAKVFSWLLTRKIEINTLNNIGNNSKLTNKYTNYDNLGFSAIATSDGFRSDGSYFYSKTIFGMKDSPDKGFLNTFSRIERGNSRFQYGNHMSKIRVEYFYKIMSIIQENKSNIILFIPPISNSVYNKMKNYKYNYINEFRELISEQPFENYDYHELSILTKNDCECIDGFHGGDIVYKRILENMYNENSIISEYLNIDNIRSDINTFKGNTLSILETDVFKNEEVNFLKLDCNKSINKEFIID